VVHVTGRWRKGKLKIERLLLVGPSGGYFDLLHGTQNPTRPPATTAI
jgi:hypothetical protein